MVFCFAGSFIFKFWFGNGGSNYELRSLEYSGFWLCKTFYFIIFDPYNVPSYGFFLENMEESILQEKGERNRYRKKIDFLTCLLVKKIITFYMFVWEEKE